MRPSFCCEATAAARPAGPKSKPRSELWTAKSLLLSSKERDRGYKRWLQVSLNGKRPFASLLGFDGLHLAGCRSPGPLTSSVTLPASSAVLSCTERTSSCILSPSTVRLVLTLLLPPSLLRL